MTQFEAIVKLTEDSNKPIKAYSPAYGWLLIKEVFTKDAPYHEIRCEVNKGNVVYFTRDLVLCGAGEHAKQMLFPNQECEDWVTYTRRIRPDLNFHINELVVCHRDGMFVLARITDIRRDRIEVQVTENGLKQLIPTISVCKLKEIAELLKSK